MLTDYVNQVEGCGVWAIADGFMPSFTATPNARESVAASIKLPIQGGAKGGSAKSIAVIHLVGVLGKGRSFFADTSTIDVRREVRDAAADDSVQSILLHVDSPGGIVNGTAELAADVKAASQVKPVYAYI